MLCCESSTAFLRMGLARLDWFCCWYSSATTLAASNLTSSKAFMDCDSNHCKMAKKVCQSRPAGGRPRRVDCLTACSRCVRARSVFFVYCSRILPSCRWVRASTRGGGLKLNTACKHWMHILIRFDVRKFSASPSSDRYQASCEDAIGWVLRRCPAIGIRFGTAIERNLPFILTVTLHLSTIVIITKNCQQNTPEKPRTTVDRVQPLLPHALPTYRTRGNAPITAIKNFTGYASDVPRGVLLVRDDSRL